MQIGIMQAGNKRKRKKVNCFVCLVFKQSLASFIWWILLIFLYRLIYSLSYHTPLTTQLNSTQTSLYVLDQTCIVMIQINIQRKTNIGRKKKAEAHIKSYSSLISILKAQSIWILFFGFLLVSKPRTWNSNFLTWHLQCVDFSYFPIHPT